MQTKVAEENQQQGDIIQKDFVAIYASLTLKTMLGIKWVKSFCPGVSFVMKTDLGIFINIPCY